MATTLSKVTAQGQTSVPSEVRRRLGIGPGSTLEWTEERGEVVVRRKRTYTSEEIHRAIFGGKKPGVRTIEEMEEGIRQAVRTRHEGR